MERTENTTENVVIVKPDTLTRTVTLLGNVAPEVGASVVNGVAGTVHHCKTSPKLRLAGANIRNAKDGVVTSTKVRVGIAREGFSSEEAKAKRAETRAKIGGFFKKVADKAPVKVVIETSKDIASDAKRMWDDTDIHAELVVAECEGVDNSGHCDEDLVAAQRDEEAFITRHANDDNALVTCPACEELVPADKPHYCPASHETCNPDGTKHES